MTLTSPAVIKAEHEELHNDLRRAVKAEGATGEAAREVARLMHPHFIKEEEYALPPLALLPRLAAGEIEPSMYEAIALTDRLEADLPSMLAEHKQIVAALDRLTRAATAEGKTEQAAFAQRLISHAQIEETVSYPAALLVGRYLKAMAGRSG